MSQLKKPSKKTPYKQPSRKITWQWKYSTSYKKYENGQSIFSFWQSKKNNSTHSSLYVCVYVNIIIIIIESGKIDGERKKHPANNKLA